MTTHNVRFESDGITTRNVKITAGGKDINFVKEAIITLNPNSIIEADVRLCGVTLAMEAECAKSTIDDFTFLNEKLRAFGWEILPLHRGEEPLLLHRGEEDEDV